jgi:hypothetical protein
MSAPQIFDELLEVLMPWSGGNAVVLRAYFDASKMPKTGTFCVAGIAYGRDRAKKAEGAWRRLFGNRICHMTDLSSRRDEFEGISPEEGGRLIRAAVPIIRDNATAGVAVSCDVNEIANWLPKKAVQPQDYLLSGFRAAYPTCCHIAMHTLGRKTARQAGTIIPNIAYVFEQGDAFQNDAHLFINQAMKDSDVLRNVYGYRSHGYVLKEDARLLETADVLAWEWAKHVDRMKAGQHVRPSLSALIGDGKKPVDSLRYNGQKFFAQHMTGVSLQRFFDFLGQLLMAGTTEEVVALAASRPPLYDDALVEQ